MTFSAPKVADLFSDASPKEAAERMEEFTSELSKSLSNASSVPGQAPQADPTAQLEALVANKSLTPDAASGLQNALAAQRLAMQDIQKDITLTSPLSTSFAAFDLEAPAKMLTPRPTPLRNRIPRKKRRWHKPPSEANPWVHRYRYRWSRKHMAWYYTVHNYSIWFN
jgi:hypothetical protein